MVSDDPTSTTKDGVNPAFSVPYGALRDIDSAAVLKEINRLLSGLDPDFDKSVRDINSADLSPGDSGEELGSDSIDIDKILEDKSSSGPTLPDPSPKLSFKESLTQVREELTDSVLRMIAGVREARLGFMGLFGGGFKGLVPRLLGASKSALSGLKTSLTDLKSLSKQNLFTVLGILVLTAACGLILYRTFKGTLLPKIEVNYLRSFESVADHAYNYKEDEPFEEFNSPLRHPEYVVALDKVIVNLKSSSQSDSPMGMFEFYIEATSKDAAIEINDRENEVRDAVSRTTENITYDEVATSEGKTKLKLILRIEINKILTRGRVRRVFFKSIILKP